MHTGEEPLRIIGNESNQVYEIEPGGNPQQSAAGAEKDKAKEQPVADNSNAATPPNNDLATNDGGIAESLDTAFHNKPGMVEGINPSGSNRADYYEAQSYGQSDAEEETTAAT